MLLYANRKDIRIFNANSRNDSMIIDHLIAVDCLFAEGIIFWADVNLKKKSDEFASPQEKLKMLFQLV